jgi:phosphoribosylformylglycinamidine synthase
LFKVKVKVKRRKSILDPQGKAAEQGAKLLGFTNIKNVRIDKSIEFNVHSTDVASAEKEVKEFCNKLLANPIMEDYEITMEKVNES